MFKKIKDNAGYVSIETVVIAGLMLALGTFIITQIFEKAQAINDAAMTNMDSIFDVVDGITIIG